MMKRILIAGVSGAIGRALTEHLLDQYPDCAIVGLCRVPEEVREEVAHTQRLHLIPWDAWDETSSDQVVRRLQDIFSPKEGLDTVIYTAGLLHSESMQPEKRLEDVGRQNIERSFRVNAFGFLGLVQALVPWLTHRQFKRVVAISAKVGSISDNGMGGWYAYRGAKAALNMFVRNLSIELRRRNRSVACIALHPGTTATSLSEPFQRSLAQLTVHSPRETATNLVKVISSLSEQDNGKFLSWDGAELPW